MICEREIYRIQRLPVSQNLVFPDQQSALNCNTGDLLLVQDGKTGLIFNKNFDPTLVLYTPDYQNEQAFSGIFQSHLQTVAGLIEAHFAGYFLVEVGCGKGRFLEHLYEAGFDICGLDPTYEGENPLIRKEYFTREQNLRADGIILRHVLEHVQDPIEFLMQIRDANGGGGRIYIEVPCLEWICNHHAWFDLFYEHVNYFRLQDFHRMFSRVYRSGHVFGGQYLYVIADLSTIKSPVREQEDQFCFPSDFSAGLVAWADKLKNKNSPTVVWGGASKGVIFSLLMQRAGAVIDFVVDINPAKQEKYLPSSGLRVYAPEEVKGLLGSCVDIVVMNSNYLSEIKQATDNKFNYWTVDYE